MEPITTVIPSSDEPRSGALFLGSIEASSNTELLNSHNIWHIVQVMGKWPLALKDEGYTYYSVEIDDRPDQKLGPHLEGATAFIEEHLTQGRNVLVHCFEGKSRSPSIVIAYLIRYRGMTYDEASTMLKEKRPGIKPNSAFIAALFQWAQVENSG